MDGWENPGKIEWQNVNYLRWGINLLPFSRVKIRYFAKNTIRLTGSHTQPIPHSWLPILEKHKRGCLQKPAFNFEICKLVFLGSPLLLSLSTWVRGLLGLVVQVIINHIQLIYYYYNRLINCYYELCCRERKECHFTPSTPEPSRGLHLPFFVNVNPANQEE